MKGESVFAADIGAALPKDNVVCESRSPWLSFALFPSSPTPLSLRLLSPTKGSLVVVVVVISPTITSIIYGNETERGVRRILLSSMRDRLHFPNNEGSRWRFF